MTIPAENLLGVGVYTPDEAALYARVRPATMNRWLFGDGKGSPVLKPQVSHRKGDRVVTFLDFVQSLHIRQIRTELQIPLPKIRQAIENAEKTYGVEYPLARQHTTGLYGDELIIRLDDERFVQLTGKEAHHEMIHQVVKLYMKDLTFGDEGLASAYRAYEHNDFEVWMNPLLRFGEPLLKSCGYSAKTLWEAAATEGSIERAAEMYGVTPDEVETAYRYYGSLALPA